MKKLVIGPDDAKADRAVLVPGNDLCAEFYVPLAEALAARGIRTTLLTLPGFHGIPPYAQPSWPRLVDDVARLFESERAATLLGHSLGGLTALLVAARRPRGLARLALLEPNIFGSKLIARAAAWSYSRNVVAGDRTQFMNWTGSYRRIHDERRYPRSAIDLYLEVRRTSDPATAAALMRGLPSLYPLPFDETAVPILHLRGESTGWRSRVAVALLRRKLPHARFEMLPRCAHWIANEADNAAAEHISAFIRSTPP